jgi:ABC-2 type transport system ATP-binding protein
MRRRLDLAMSLISAPRVVFLDEPTTGLDPASRATTWDAIAELVAGGTTLVLTTQYLEEADRLADRIVLIDAGRVTAEGTPDELKSRVGGERLVLHLVDPADRPLALSVLGVVLPAGPDPCLVELASDGSAEHLRAVLERLHDAGVALRRVSAHRPTLDDAFLALTSRTPQPAPALA